MSKYSIEKFFLNEEYPQARKARNEYVNELIKRLGLGKQIRKAVKQFEEMIKPELNYRKIIREYMPFFLAYRVRDAIESTRSKELLSMGFTKNDLPKIVKATDEELKNIIYQYNERSWDYFYSNLSEKEKSDFKPALIERAQQQTEYDFKRVHSILSKYETREVKEKYFEQLIWLSTFLKEASQEFITTGRRKKKAHKLDDETEKVYLAIMKLKKFLPRRPWTQEKLLEYFESKGGKRINLGTLKAWKTRHKSDLEIIAIIKKFNKRDFQKMICELNIDPYKLPN